MADTTQDEVAHAATGPDRSDEDALIARYIRPDRLRRGKHRARIETDHASVPVWALVGHMRGGGGIAQTAADYDLPDEAVAAAVAYYHRHRALIDARLLLNDDFFES